MIRRAVIPALLVAAILALAAEARGVSAGPPVKDTGTGVVRYRGHGAEYWHWQYQQALRREARLRRALLRQPSSLEAIRLASIAYHVPYALLLRKARCESRLDPHARNPQPIWNGEHAEGLFQFVPSTFASTPYADESIWSPYANALAAGWMHSDGVDRGGEWACR